MLDIDAASVAAPQPLPPPRVLEIRFTGSGSEYFRIWSVNLLLILVTLGLYLPFAKARRIRYFYANTLVDGQALGFHGDPWKMFRGFVLLVLLMAAYSGAGHFSPLAAFIAFLILCAVWPALWRASMQFRLGNTSWRGLRMRFEGSLAGAYLACAPSYLPAMILVASGVLLKDAPPTDPAGPAAILSMVGGLGMTLLAPWSLALFKRYQHRGYRIAGQHGCIHLSAARLYLLALKVVGISLLPMFLAGVVIAIFMGIAQALGAPARGPLDLILISLGIGLGYLVYFAFVMPYGSARLQNLVWNGTRSEALRFRSALGFRALLGLTLKNWLLTALTLSLYRPFAAVSTARLRLEAVEIEASEDPADWVAAAGAGHADATGDIAGDFFGIDMGL